MQSSHCCCSTGSCRKRSRKFRTQRTDRFRTSCCVRRHCASRSDGRGLDSRACSFSRWPRCIPGLPWSRCHSSWRYRCWNCIAPSGGSCLQSPWRVRRCSRSRSSLTTRATLPLRASSFRIRSPPDMFRSRASCSHARFSRITQGNAPKIVTVALISGAVDMGSRACWVATAAQCGGRSQQSSVSALCLRRGIRGRDGHRASMPRHGSGVRVSLCPLRAARARSLRWLLARVKLGWQGRVLGRRAAARLCCQGNPSGDGPPPYVLGLVRAKQRIALCLREGWTAEQCTRVTGLSLHPDPQATHLEAKVEYMRQRQLGPF